MAEITEKAIIGLLLAFGLSVALFIKSAFTAGLFVAYTVAWFLMRWFFRGKNPKGMDMPEINRDLWDFIEREKDI